MNQWLWIALGSSWLAACSDDSSGRINPSTQQLPGGTAVDAGSEVSAGDGAVPAEPAASDTTSEGQPNASLEPGAGVTSSGEEAVDPCSLDRDFDGTSDCTDECPSNFAKTAPGICGCSIADTDVDFDGAIDCQDPCPLDPSKVEPGVCGCGVADADGDEDGAIDCQEDCPFDAERTEAGACGCGAPDDLPLCLRHRYSFDGEGATLIDRVGGADGILINTTLTGTGNLAIEGGASEQYVVLPPGIISALGPSATIEAWVSWTGAGGSWQRIFDFGSSDVGPGLQGNGATYLFLTPSNGTDLTLRTAMTNAGLASETFVGAASALPFPERVHVAVVVDAPAQTFSLYLQGVLLGRQPLGALQLARLNDIDNYLGRSQWVFDEEFQGVYDEFRLYGAALTRQQLGALVAAGPDELPDLPVVTDPAPAEDGPDAGSSEPPPSDTEQADVLP